MKENQFIVSTCPTCGSAAIRKVKGRWTGNFRGKSYTVSGVEYFACRKCGEKVYPPGAMRRIRERSPAYLKPRSARCAS
ncbi:MAG: YgiT-type zinc finger protein [Candidatus Binatia bacterium]